MVAKGPDQARANNSKPKPAKVKVSQDTIDKIKQMGMTKALAGIRGSSGAEYKEALRRMYGERRLTAALSGNTPVKTKSADAAKAKSTAVTAAKPAPKPSAKKGMSFGDKLKKIAVDTAKGSAKDILTFGTGGAGAAGAVGAKVAIKAGTVAAKRGLLSKAGQVAAKSGKAVSQSQYDAMVANASRVPKTTVAKQAAKTVGKAVAKTTTTAAKTTAKKAVAVKTATTKVATNTGAKLRTADEARMSAMKTPKGKKK